MRTTRTTNDAIYDVFRDERDEACTRIVDALLRLESDPDALDGIAQEILRVAHGLKGAAFAAGFPITARFVHDLETCVSLLRRRGVPPDPIAVQALYDATDAIPKIVAGESGEVRVLDPHVATTFDALVAVFGSDVGLTPPELDERGTDEGGGSSDGSSSVRVPVGKLDRVLETAGELIAGRAVAAAFARTSETLVSNSSSLQRRIVDLAMSMRSLERSSGGEAIARARKSLEECAELATQLASEMSAYDDATRTERRVADTTLERLHDDVRALRLVPVGVAFGSFARLVRDVAAASEKSVEIVVEGSETEVDRDLLETVREAIAHLLRNAVVHGIESPAGRRAAAKPDKGRVTVSASTFGREARIEVVDDGGGIDPDAVASRAIEFGLTTSAEVTSFDAREKLELVFAPGFSTVDSVDSVAGRGVGLDAVRATASRLGGRVTVHSERGRGTRFVLELPVSRAAIDLVLVDASDALFAVPAAHVERIVRVEKKDVSRGDRGPSFEVDGRPVRIAHLSEVLGGRSKPLDDSLRPAILLRSASGSFAYIVDRILDHRQRLTKGLSEHLGSVPLVQGATVLADGTVVPILDVDGLVEASEGPAHDVVTSQESRAAVRKRRVLVVDDSITTRTLQKGILEAAGYDVVVATNGVEALEKLARGGIELVLSDVEMPKMDGIELAGRIKSDDRTKALPVVIVSSLGKPEDRERGLRAGADAYIAKGEFDQGALLETLRRLL